MLNCFEPRTKSSTPSNRRALVWLFDSALPWAQERQDRGSVCDAQGADLEDVGPAGVGKDVGGEGGDVGSGLKAGKLL